MTFSSAPEHRVLTRVLPWLVISDFHHIMSRTNALCQQFVLTVACSWASLLKPYKQAILSLYQSRVQNMKRLCISLYLVSVGDIPTAGSVVDPHCCQCGSGSSMLDQSYSDLVPDLGPDPGLHEGRLSYGRDLQLLKQNMWSSTTKYGIS